MRDVSSQLRQPRRLKQLEVRRILDTPEDPLFDRITRLVAHSLRCPVSLLTFVDSDRQWFKSAFGLSEPWRTLRQTPLSHSFCQFVVADGQPLIISDARGEPAMADNRAIHELKVVAYLGVPLIDEDGSVLGSLAAVDCEPRVWTPQEQNSLKDFAVLAMREVRLGAEVAYSTELQEHLRHSQKLESLGQLAAGIAHDFNNIMLVIDGYVKLLAECVSDREEAIAYVAEINRASERVRGLIRQLLTFGRRQPAEPERLSFSNAVRQMEDLLRRTLGPGLELEFQLAQQPFEVLIDRVQFEQVVLNLVINARDACAMGGRVVIRTLDRPHAIRRFDPGANPDNWVELQVQDFGAGIEPDALPHIFEPFFTTKRKEEGSGLGLSIVYGIVTQSHGYIFVDSQPGSGTIFHVLLPRAA